MTLQVGPMTVLETKLYIPRWPAGLLTRPRLVARVRAGVEGKLTVLSAPAGSGKTTLLAEWLAQREADELPVGWVSLDAGDNEPAFFWSYLIRALQKIAPNVGQQVLAALQPGAAPDVPLLTTLVNEIATCERDAVLILDDYHVIETPAIHTALAFFLDHLPDHMHVIIATRVDPVLPLARLRARGELNELRASDLRFNSDEAWTFLNGTMTLDLADADVAALEKRTEGWVTGLKLAALSMQSQPDARAFIDSFSGDNRYIADYLIEEVLQGQPEHMRRFLSATSILDRLSAPLCDAVTGETGSQVLLEYLEKRNLFVIALDDRREWYRYHHLFAEVLQAHAAREDTELVRAAHRRASAWYEQNGAAAEAVQHALRAHDLERVAELLERHWPPKDRSYASRRWLERVKALPEAIVQARPLLNMGYAWGLLNAGDLEGADLRLRELEASLGDDRYPTLAREHATASVYLAQSRGDAGGTVEHARRVFDLAPAGDSAARATGAALLGLAYWGNGDLDAAHDTFASALASMRSAGAELDAIRGEFVLGDIRATQGRLGEAVRIYQAGIALANAHKNAEADELYLGLSEVKLERGNLHEAASLLREIDERASRAAHFSNRHRWCVAMARLEEARGDLNATMKMLSEAETNHRRDPLPVTRPIAAMKARIALAIGDVATAARWGRERGLSDDGELSFIREYDYITLARLLIAQNQLPQAIALLERLNSHAQLGSRLGSVVETLVLQALAHDQARNTVNAMDAIAAALELAEPEEFSRVFVNEGVAIRDLLRRATARGISGAYTRRVLAAFQEPSQPTTTNGAATPHLLTSREHEILRLLATGMRNQEIAKQLFISPATVKRHIANVYNKLDASHRTEALKRAGALNLL